MSRIFLYNISDSPNKVHKSVGVTKADLAVDILPDCTLKNPRLKVNANNFNVAKCNYFFFDEFNRYYYLRDCNLLQHGIYEITGEVDPLKSFEGGISGLTCLVLRNENAWNGDIVDEEIVPRIKRQITKKVIGNVGKLCNIVVTVAGGDNN